MAAKKRAGSKGAKGSVRSAKAGSPAKTSQAKGSPGKGKKGASKAAKPKPLAPKALVRKKNAKPQKSAPLKSPRLKSASLKSAAEKSVVRKAEAQKAGAKTSLVKKPAAAKNAASDKPKKNDSPKAGPKAPAQTSGKTAQTSGKAPKNAPAKESSGRLAIPPPPSKGAAVAQSTRGMTKPGALGTGPVRLIPASSPSSMGLKPPATPASRPAPAKGTKAQGLTLVRRSTERPAAVLQTPVLPIPVRPLAAPMSIEDRAASIEKRLAAQTDDFRKRYIDSFDMSWIYHDSALEGVVYTLEELKSGLTSNPEAPLVLDSSLQPAADEIKRHKEAIEYVRDFGTKKRLPVTIDVIKKIYLILHPSEGDLKTVKYRKDIPQHRLYFHEYAAPDKIAYKVRQVIDWLNEPETKKTRNALRIAARAHYDLLRVFPFQTDSGKVARLFMNLLLMRAGYPPSLIHSTERQRYYDALKGSANIVLAMVQESVENALSSVEKLLDEHETKTRAFVN
jgi:hypothetical protein